MGAGDTVNKTGDLLGKLGAFIPGLVPTQQPTQQQEQPIQDGTNNTENNPSGNNAQGQANQLTPPSVDSSNSEDIISQLTSQGVSPEIAQQFASKLPQQQGLGGVQITPEMAIMAQLLLPPSEASKLQKAFDIQQKAQKAQSTNDGKQLPAGELFKLGETQTAIDLLPEVQKAFDNNKGVFGPVLGRARSLNPYDTRAQDAQSTIFLVKQIIGKGLEGGVLRKEDESKYANILPKLSDTPETVQKKIDLLNNTLTKRYQTMTKTFEKGGYNPTGNGQASDVQQLLEILSQQGLNLGS